METKENKENYKNKIITISTFWNCEKYIENCVSSLVTQRYDNYKMIFIDDASTTTEGWDKLPHNDSRAICIRNKERKTALENLHFAIMNYCEEDSLICLVDGDDKLINKLVINEVNNIFFSEKEETEIKKTPWFSYGQFVFSTGQRGFASAYTKEEFKNIRKSPFRVSHLRVFRKKLYSQIGKQDSDYQCFKDKNGKFYTISYDCGICFPLLDLCNIDYCNADNRIHFNNKIFYWYNIFNEFNDHKINQLGQTNTHIEIANKKPFNFIKSLE